MYVLILRGVPTRQQQRDYLLQRRYEREKRREADQNQRAGCLLLCVVLLVVFAVGGWLLSVAKDWGVVDEPYDRVKAKCDSFGGRTEKFTYRDEERGSCYVEYDGLFYEVPISDSGELDRSSASSDSGECGDTSFGPAGRWHEDTFVCEDGDGEDKAGVVRRRIQRTCTRVRGRFLILRDDDPGSCWVRYSKLWYEVPLDSTGRFGRLEVAAKDCRGETVVGDERLIWHADSRVCENYGTGEERLPRRT